ncbi:MAG: FtsQ-type POTRA domain-containing protein [Kiritimatiellae bacterium]|nr:FtsQ-type POTRA domain-containing protein [Kiritimatiellia bacterium]
MGLFRKKPKRGNYRRSGNRSSILEVSARGGKQGSDRAHKVGALLLVLLVVGVIVWAAVSGVALAGTHLFAENERFTIQRIDAVSTGVLTPSHLREYAKVSDGMNLFAINIGNVCRNLERAPRVKKAEVRRELPDTLVIRVQERTAIARMLEGAHGMPVEVDSEGYILGLSPKASLPLITGASERGLAPGSVIRDEKTLDALRVLELSERMRRGDLLRFQSINVSKADALELVLDTGGRVLLGRDQLKWRLERLADLIETHRAMNQQIEVANLVVDKNFPTTTRAIPEASPR